MVIKRTGGRQRKSITGKLKSLLGEEVSVTVRSNDWDKEVFIRGTLEKKDPSGSYQIEGTRARIPIKYSIVRPDGEILVDLSRSPFGYFYNYMSKYSKVRPLKRSLA